MNLPTVAISIRQPRAWAILSLGKDVENLTWATSYRGPILLHAGKRFRLDEVKGDILYCLELTTNEAVKRLCSKWTAGNLKKQTGGIVGMVTIKDCITNSPSPWAEPGRRHWLLTDPKPLPFFPCKGRLGLFPVEYPQHLLEAAA
jgi:hypothetical protein